MALDVARSLSGGLAIADRLRVNKRQDQIQQLQQNISGAGSGFDPLFSQDVQQLTGLDPQLGAQALSTFNALSDGRKKAFFDDAESGLNMLNQGNFQGVMELINNRRQLLSQIGGDTSDVDAVANSLQQGDIQGAKSQLEQAVFSGINQGFLTDPLDREIKRKQAARGGKSSKMLEIESLISIAENDPNAETIKGRAAHVELGLIARASKSAAERIAEDEKLAAQIVKIEGEKAAATEKGKLGQQLIHKPAITTAVKLAEKQALERGDVLNALQRSQAAFPGLITATDELKELAQISTSTFGGKLFDAAVKQSGFGSTKGATARAKFIAIVNNQVLPLLKETFGAAFTFQEGESLKATMGSPDSSPEEKMVEIDAFIAQKMRDIETKQLQLSQPAVIGAQTNASTSSDEELKARLGL